MLKKMVWTLLTFTALNYTASAKNFNYEDSPPVQEGYFDIQPLSDDKNNYYQRSSDIADLISMQSPIKSQGKRGTCSIFSTTALLEFYLQQLETRGTEVNLSEQWATYLAHRSKTEEGSYSPINFQLYSQYGVIPESVWAYNFSPWKTINDTEESYEECGSLSYYMQKYCLVSQRNPNLLHASAYQLKDENSPLFDLEFLEFRNTAQQYRNKLPRARQQGQYRVSSAYEVKSKLAQGTPVVVDLNFFYGAWNHRYTEQIGIPRNMQYWNLGIVTFPEYGSLDAYNSPRKPAGHSVLLVGFDDDITINVGIPMANGTTQYFTYRGAYIFKNSWGVDGFGKDFEYNGVNYPGYGYLPYKYAQQYGNFYSFPFGR